MNERAGDLLMDALTYITPLAGSNGNVAARGARFCAGIVTARPAARIAVSVTREWITADGKCQIAGDAY